MPSPDPPFVVDLHAHYPMHIDPNAQSVRAHIRRSQKHEKLLDKILFGGLEIADRLFNRDHPTDPHAVTVDTLVQGNVSVALSVAYWPFSELDTSLPYGSPPEDEYFDELHKLLKRVEASIRGDARAMVARSYADLERARSEGKVALIHAVEGGFHIGGSDDAIVRNVGKLASLGAGYVTVAHLFFRQVATNVPALPFLPDGLYRLLFPQAKELGLDPRGKLLIREMVRHGILIDLTHMSERGMDDTFELLDELDPGKTLPVIASHIACSFGKYEYNLKESYVKRIAERGGVCGIIYCDHYMRDGRGGRTKTLADSFKVIQGQIARLRAWGGDDILAIGTDLDGFITPTLAGLDSAANHRDLALLLEDTYGRPLAEKICHANALRVFEKAWMKPRAV